MTAVLEIGIARLERLLLGRHQRHRPILVGDAEPAVGRLAWLELLVLFDRSVFVLLQALRAGIADQALMQHIGAGDGRLVIAGDAAVVEQRYRCAARILHGVRDSEHIIVVHRDGALEGEALVVGVGERHRRRWRQRRIAIGGPHRFRARHRSGLVVADETDFGEIAIGQRRGVEQLDLGRVLVDRLAVMFEPQVVEARAGEVDGTLKARRVDLDALRRRNRLFPVGCCHRLAAWRIGDGAGRRSLCPGRSGVGAAARFLLLRFGTLLLDAGLLALLLHARVHVEHLPQRQDQHRQRDGDEEIAVVFHRKPLAYRVPRSRRESSAFNWPNGMASTSSRPTMT